MEYKSDEEEHQAKRQRQICPYLDTINRHVLDFDFQKLCSISLSNLNAYCCLVCGKYFQGRGIGTHAHQHSLDSSHHVFINLNNGKVYCLPENYEVVDSALDDIKYNLIPTYTTEEAESIDHNNRLSQTVLGIDYLSGFLGLNNLNSTDFINVVVHALAHVAPLRNYFLTSLLEHCSPLTVQFANLIRKIWNSHSFKGQVSPHEFLEEVSIASSRKFQIGRQVDCMDFMSWLLHFLHRDLCRAALIKAKGRVNIESATKVKLSNKHIESQRTIITDVFRGGVKIDVLQESKAEEAKGSDHKVSTTPFLFLSLDLPPAPLFKEDPERNIIPQVPLFNILSKFDGVTEKEELTGERKRYSLTKLPPYLILHFKRFKPAKFFYEKNPTIVNFPIRNLDMRPYLQNPPPTLSDLEEMSIADLQEIMRQHQISTQGCIEKSDLIEKIKSSFALSTRYNLIANICHEGEANITKFSGDLQLGGSYKVHIQNKADKQWYEIQDLFVQETMPQFIGLSESYIQIYELEVEEYNS